MSSLDRFSSPASKTRTAWITAAVVFSHAAALWALQVGLTKKPVEIIVPATVIAQFVAPPAPETPPAPPPPPKAPPVPPPPRPAVVKKATPKPTPVPLAVTEAAPPPNAPLVAAAEPQPPAAPAAPAAAPTPAPAAPAAPAPERVELPSSNAAYLQNPAPGYPAISKRMGEQGKVLLRVFIAADGTPQKIELNQSSGFDRLDRQAHDAVMRWRFVPGKRNGVPESMWFLVPINFVLE